MKDFTEYHKKEHEKREARKAYLKQRPQQIKDNFERIRSDIKESFDNKFSDVVSKQLLKSIEELIDFKLEVFKEEYDKEVDNAIRSAPSGGPW